MLSDPPFVFVRCVDGANLEETTVQGLYGCWPDLFLWVWRAYELDYTWDQAGKNDACNVRRPFAKVVNAAFLINYALSDNYIPQWHSTEDYRTSSRAMASRFHDHYHVQLFQQMGTAEASSQPTRPFSDGSIIAEGRIKLLCRLFSPVAPSTAPAALPSNVPSNRASVMLHESWHHWQYRHGFDSKHPQCGTPSRDCDYYYFHGTGDFDFGQLDRYDTTPGRLRFHSPYQIAVEFDSDLAEMSAAWVPLIVTQSARNVGNTRLMTQFANAVGYRIGNPRPF